MASLNTASNLSWQKLLGYIYKAGNRVGRANHMRIYDLLSHGYLPRSPERLQKLRDIAATMPEDWFEQIDHDGIEAAGTGHAF